MASPVTVTFSTTNGGAAVSDSLDHGNLDNGGTSSAKEIFIRHDGSFVITQCSLYLRKFSGSYDGSSTATNDFNEFLGWGNATTEAEFGGFHFNLDATGSYDSSYWPTVSTKSTSRGYAVRSGVGDSPSTGITLLTNTGATTQGQVQVGSSPNVRFQCKIKIPTNENTTGIRLVESAMTFTYTS